MRAHSLVNSLGLLMFGYDFVVLSADARLAPILLPYIAMHIPRISLLCVRHACSDEGRNARASFQRKNRNGGSYVHAFMRM